MNIDVVLCRKNGYTPEQIIAHVKSKSIAYTTMLFINTYQSYIVTMLENTQSCVINTFPLISHLHFEYEKLRNW